MVMITTMVAKIYFPSWLAPREEEPRARLSNQHYMNVLEDTYKSDFSDDEDDEEDEEDDEDVVCNACNMSP